MRVKERVNKEREIVGVLFILTGRLKTSPLATMFKSPNKCFLYRTHLVQFHR